MAAADEREHDELSELSDMSDVDASGLAERYDRLLQRVAGSMQVYKRRSYELLQLRPGHRVLEVGAGTGEDAAALAGLVAPGGRVVAVDKSHDLLQRARERAAVHEAQIDFRHGDAHALDLGADSFDACRAERVFQHLADPVIALGEMHRVLRRGGRALVIDADYETLTLDATDREVTRCVVRRRCDAAVQGWIGRQLPRLFLDAGFEVLAIEGLTFTCTDHDLALEMFQLEAAARQVVTADELARPRVDAWLDQLAERGRRGRFFLASHGFLVAGRKTD